MFNVAQSRWWSTWATGNTAVPSPSLAALLLPPGCGWLPTPRLLTLPSLPAQDASRALARLSKEEQLLQRCQSTCKIRLLLFTLVEKAMAGQAKPTWRHLQDLLPHRRCCKVFVFNRLVLQMKGKLQIHPEDNVKGQAGVSCKISSC